MSRETQLQAALARVPTMGQDQLKATRGNALSWGEEAAPLLAAIDARLTVKRAPEGMRMHRLDFARHVLSLVAEGPPGEWVRGSELVERAKRSMPDSPYLLYAAEGTGRMIPLTQALADALPTFPAVERRKDGDRQGAAVFFRRRLL